LSFRFFDAHRLFVRLALELLLPLVSTKQVHNEEALKRA
jgi:hypothetical protein